MQRRLTFKPVTRQTAGDFEALFAGPGGPNYCWCMAWRASAAELKDAKGPARREQMLGRIEDGVPVGLLGYAEDEPRAWVSVAPRDTFRSLGGPQAEGGEVVWSLTCMFLHRSLRGEGIGNELIEAAVAYARDQEADLLEAYPVDPDSPSYRHMGFVPAFERLGFVKIGQVGTRRHVMRLTLSAKKAGNP